MQHLLPKYCPKFGFSVKRVGAYKLQMSLITHKLPTVSDLSFLISNLSLKTVVSFTSPAANVQIMVWWPFHTRNYSATISCSEIFMTV